MTTRREFWLALCGATALRAQQGPTFTVTAEDEPVRVDVTQKQRPLSILSAEDFRLFINGQPQTIRGITFEELPIDLVLVFEIYPRAAAAPDKWAANIFGATRARMLNGAANLLLRTRSQDRVAFLAEGATPRIELPFTNDRDTLAGALRRIGEMEPQGTFSELLTIEYAVRMFGDLGPAPDRRRLIVRLGSSFGGAPFADEAVIERLRAENIIFSYIETFYRGGGFNPGFGTSDNPFIGPGVMGIEPTGPLYRRENPLHIAYETGGDARTYLDPKTPEDLITHFRPSYVLWFRPQADLGQRTRRSLSVELSPDIRHRFPDAVIRER